MLIATPYREFDVRDKSPPKIISEIRKSYASCSSTPSFGPKLSSDLLLKTENEKRWWPRKVIIRGGQLLVLSVHGEDGPIPQRLPLRHLSLQAGPLPNSLSLCRGQHIVLTLQTANERAFDEWVKTIAIELIRQTPLAAIKYLDILTIADCSRRDNKQERDWNHNYTTNNKETPNNINSSYNVCDNNSSIPSSADLSLNVTNSPNASISSTETVPVKEKDVEDLLKKCQNVENYVPVKEKLFLFESLCKMGRKVRSTEDVSQRIDVITKRARSLHDLSSLNTHIAVREICKYFENKTDINEPQKQMVNHRASKRLVLPDSHCDKVYKCRKVYAT